MRRFYAVILPGLLALCAIISCSKGVTKGDLTPHDQFDKAMALYQKEDFLKAQGEFQKVIYGYPGLTFIDTAQYYLAMSFYHISSYPEAIGEFRKLTTTYPASPLADDAQYYLAMAHYKESPSYSHEQTETYAAVDEFGIFLDKYSDSPLADSARMELDRLYDKLAKKLFKSGELYLRLNDYEPAIIYFGQVRDNYSNTDWAKDSFFYTGVAQMKQGKKPEALETFQNFVITFPDHKLTPKAQKYIAKLSPSQPGS
jgi:outer membrane protein assembly factor BamD